MDVQFVRALRTPNSERFLLHREANDVATLDIHYLADSTVQATLIIFSEAAISEAEIPSLLQTIDEVLLPNVSLDDKKLIFTVVVGRVLGSFESTPDLATDPNQPQQ